MCEGGGLRWNEAGRWGVVKERGRSGGWKVEEEGGGGVGVRHEQWTRFLTFNPSKG